MENEHPKIKIPEGAWMIILTIVCGVVVIAVMGLIATKL
jgi:hypothetical protein